MEKAIVDLHEFRQRLMQLTKEKKISKDTADTYYSCMKTVSKTVNKVTPKSLKDFLIVKCKSKNDFLKYIAAIRKYEDQVLRMEKGLLFGEPEVELFEKFKGRAVGSESKIFSGNSEDSIFRKINAIRNERLKLGFRLQLKSGLRVAEVAKIRKNDIEFLENDRIVIHVRDGKGRKARDVSVLQDKYLYNRLKKYTEESENDKLFYSRSYIKQKAKEYGIRTHDLRRINAQSRLAEEVNMGKNRREAIKTVQEALGHASPETTRIYLRYHFGKKE